MAGHDRATLHAALDVFLGAPAARDHRGLRWADSVRHSENNVMIAPGDGLWGTIDRPGDYALRFADERAGQVGHFGTENGVQTTDKP